MLITVHIVLVARRAHKSKEEPLSVDGTTTDLEKDQIVHSKQCVDEANACLIRSWNDENNACLNRSWIDEKNSYLHRSSKHDAFSSIDHFP